MPSSSTLACKNLRFMASFIVDILFERSLRTAPTDLPDFPCMHELYLQINFIVVFSVPNTVWWRSNGAKLDVVWCGIEQLAVGKTWSLEGKPQASPTAINYIPVFISHHCQCTSKPSDCIFRRCTRLVQQTPQCMLSLTALITFALN